MSILTTNDPQYTIADLGFDKSLVKTDLDGITPELHNIFFGGIAPKLITAGELLEFVDTGHAGISGEGDTVDSIRFWAGDTFANRATAPFRITEAGIITARRLTLENFFNDDHSSIVYTGTWAQEVSGVLFGRTRTKSTTINDFFTISFTGASIGLILSKATDQGKMEISIDGVFQENVDLYNTTLFTRSIVYSIKTLSIGSHTLKGRIIAKNVASSAEGVALQGYTLFPHDGIKMEQLSAELFVYTVSMLTDANGYKTTATSTPTGYSMYHVVAMRLTEAVMSDATLTDPITAWRTTELYLYNGAADTTYSVTVTLLISKI